MAYRYVGNVRTEVSADVIMADLTTRGIRNARVELNVETARSKSFKVSFNRDDGEKIDDAAFWPSNVIVRRWHNPRQKRPPIVDPGNVSNTSTNNASGGSGSSGGARLPLSTS